MPGNRRPIPPQDAPAFTRPPDDAYDDPNVAYDAEEQDFAESYIRHQFVNDAITTRLIEKLTGRGEDTETLYGSQPSKHLFGGALSSQYAYRQAQAEDDAFQEFAEDVAPFTIGVRFRIPTDLPNEATVNIHPRAKGYQRRFPTLDEQLTHSNAQDNADVLFEAVDDGRGGQRIEQERPDKQDSDDEGVAITDGGTTAVSSDSEGPSKTQELVRVYERIPFRFSTLELSISAIQDLVEMDSVHPVPLTEAIRDAKAEARAIEDRFRERARGLAASEANAIPVSRLEDNETFQAYLNQTFPGKELDPLWDARLELEAHQNDGDGYITVVVRLVNTQGENYDEATDPKFEAWRVTLLDVGVEATLHHDNGDTPTLIGFESERIEDEYQYDGTIYGVGENCAVDPVYPEGGHSVVGAPAVGVQTRTVPTYHQARYLSRNPKRIAAPFDTLAGNNGREAVFNTLTRIASAMEEAKGDYEQIEEDILSGKPPSAQRSFRKAIDEFDRERERFETGIHLLRDNERAYEAFTMMNQAFTDLGYDRWRTFQIVFIVMAVPDMVAQAKTSDGPPPISPQDERATDWEQRLPPKDLQPAVEFDHYLDTADVIYFPTGGGKTEAYFGLVVFTAFHDRLRGKQFGMTAFTKFPLRFLSLEQLERITELLAKAELIRRDHPVTSEGDEFSVGYFVGKGNTPNALYDDGNNYVELAQTDEEFKKEMLHLEACPFCGEKSVIIDGDPVQGRIVHRCTHNDCDEDVLPVYLTDREIYRFVPTFVVSTIDKIAIVGMQRRMRTLFGQAKIRCVKHGYSGESQCIVQSAALSGEGNCDQDDWAEVEATDPPSLLIQDELHLLREEFGAFDSHYETLLEAYYDRISPGWQTKIVAATATIQGAENQVRALYQRETIQFPSDGPRLRQSFYAYAHPKRTQRKMVGAIPRTVSRTYAIERVHEEWARIVQDFRRNPDDLYDAVQRVATEDAFDLSDAAFPSDPDDREEVLGDVLDDYEVQVSYHHSKDNTDLMMRVLRTMINQHLADDLENYDRISGQLMTGETTLDTVQQVMSALDPDTFHRPGPEDIRMLIATSMISHGVDQPVLNFISFFGLPRETAEYIQTYSRVGRKWPGTVFMLHYPLRSRDRSYYRRFQHHQAYQDLLVEATPLERWAEYAIECSLPGIVTSALLQWVDYYAEPEVNSPRLYMGEGLDKASDAGVLNYQSLYTFVREAYGLAPSPEAERDPLLADTSAIEIYEGKIETEFKKVWDALFKDENRLDEYEQKADNNKSNFLSGLLERDEDARKPMRSLRDIDEQILIGIGGKTSQVITGLHQSGGDDR
jgi:hypothetical protein